MVCKICNKQNDLRFGVCFQCAEAESIIGEGLDMLVVQIQPVVDKVNCLITNEDKCVDKL